MILPDPDDPEFKAYARTLLIQLLAACGFVLAFICFVVAWLT